MTRPSTTARDVLDHRGRQVAAEGLRHAGADLGAAKGADHGADHAGDEPDNPGAARGADRRAAEGAADDAGAELHRDLAARRRGQLVDDEFDDRQHGEDPGGPGEAMKASHVPSRWRAPRSGRPAHGRRRREGRASRRRSRRAVQVRYSIVAAFLKRRCPECRASAARQTVFAVHTTPKRSSRSAASGREGADLCADPASQLRPGGLQHRSLPADSARIPGLCRRSGRGATPFPPSPHAARARHCLSSTATRRARPPVPRPTSRVVRGNRASARLLDVPVGGAPPAELATSDRSTRPASRSSRRIVMAGPQ